MAFDLFNEEDDENKSQGIPGQQLGTSSETVTGDDPKSSGAPSSSGSFTNLQSYLDANKSQKFGEQAAGKVGNTVDEAENAQTTASNQFKQNVDTGTVKEDASLIDKAYTTPEKVVGTPDEESFKKMRDAKYTGADNFAGSDYYSPAQQQTSKALSTASTAADPEQRKAYLAQTYSKPGYSSGLQKLDNLLIQQDPNSRQLFDAQKARAQSASGNFQNLSGTLDAYAKQGKDTTAATRSDVRSGLGLDGDGNLIEGGSGAVQKTVGGITDKYKQALAARDADYSRLTGGIAAGRLNSSDAAKYGVSDAQRIYGLNLADPRYLSRSAAPSLNQATSVQDQARIQALSQLAGTNNTWVPDASQAGTYNPSASYGVNRDAVKLDMANAENQYKHDLGNYRVGSGHYTANIKPEAGYEWNGDRSSPNFGYQVPIEELIKYTLQPQGFTGNNKELQDLLDKFKSGHGYNNAISVNNAPLK